MEFSTDKAVAMQQVLDQLVANRDEVTTFANDFGLRNGWVCCFQKDYLPFRKLGERISAFGGKLFVANSAHYADQVARDLNAKGKGGDAGVIVLPLAAWAEKRIAVFDKLITEWKANAEEQGISVNL